MAPAARCVLAAALPALVLACSQSQAADAQAGPARSEHAVSTSLRDEPLAAHAQQLLDLGFRAATAMPIDPHIKNRSRAQEKVVAACLELRQPRRALSYIEKIDDWRRGAAYADLAFYCVRHGDTEVQQYLDLANRIAEQSSKDENAQDWRRDRIRAKIARVYTLLGKTARADAFAVGIAAAEAGPVEAARAKQIQDSAFDAQVAVLDAELKKGDFDQSRNALETCAQLFDRFYADAGRRAQLQSRIESSKAKLPVMVRIDLWIELVETALEHGDRTTALELVAGAQHVADAVTWLPQDGVPLAARLALLRARAGDPQGARSDAAKALALFDRERPHVYDIYRAAALRSVAEAYQVIGDTKVALDLYARAAEAGVENPNSRPRAEDLAATCTSLAVHGVATDPALEERLVKICDGLGPPW